MAVGDFPEQAEIAAQRSRPHQLVGYELIVEGDADIQECRSSAPVVTW